MPNNNDKSMPPFFPGLDGGQKMETQNAFFISQLRLELNKDIVWISASFFPPLPDLESAAAIWSTSDNRMMNRY
jgi:hypothetical protein